MFAGLLRGRLALVALLAAGAASQAEAQKLTGAGATFPNPIYSKWFDAYSKKTGVQINYQSVGSGAGIRQFTEGTVDFGATDGPMNESQLQAVNGNVVHLPTVLGAVVVTYNLPTLGATQLKLDGNTLVADPCLLHETNPHSVSPRRIVGEGPMPVHPLPLRPEPACP